MDLKEEIKAIKLGESLLVEFGLKEAKSEISDLNTKKRFKYISIDENKTTIVRVFGANTVHTAIEDKYESGDIFVGCFIEGNSKTVQNVVSKINTTKGRNIYYRDYNGKAYIFEDLLSKESITLDEFKAISVAMDNKKEILETKISIQ